MAEDYSEDLFDEDLSADDGDADADDEFGEDLPDDDVADEDAGNAEDKMLELADLLGEMGLVVDVDESMPVPEFLGHLCTAVRTHLKSTGEDIPEEDGKLPGESEAMEEPQMITMSLRQQLQEQQQEIIRLKQANGDDRARMLHLEIDKLSEQGRCSKAEANEWKRLLKPQQVRMSMIADRSHPQLVAVMAWMQKARTLPEGFYKPDGTLATEATPAQRKPARLSQRSAGPRPEADPNELYSESTEETKKDALNEMLKSIGLGTNGK